MILLDTHVLVWFDTNNRSLGREARDLIAAAWPSREVALSAVSFWECGMLHARGRLSLRLPPYRWRADLIDAGLNEVALSGDVTLTAATLETLHHDPADRFIVATAIAHEATLLTADAALLRWRHRGFRRTDARK